MHWAFPAVQKQHDNNNSQSCWWEAHGLGHRWSPGTFHQWKRKTAVQLQQASLTEEEKEGRNRSNTRGSAGNGVGLSGKHLQHYNAARTSLWCKVAICWQIFITARSQAVVGAQLSSGVQYNRTPKTPQGLVMLSAQVTQYQHLASLQKQWCNVCDD